jgi:hypothetical protein
MEAFPDSERRQERRFIRKGDKNADLFGKETRTPIYSEIRQERRFIRKGDNNADLFGKELL